MIYDFGFAPNPFGGICSIATCKPHIRKKATVGDWIIGTGAKGINLERRVIYLMKVTEKLLLEDYWNDPRYQFKKPILNGSLITIHGDNVYSKDEKGRWCQADCQHTNLDATIKEEHIKRDTRGKFVLLSDHFYYFGDTHFQIPDEFKSICSKSRDYHSPKSEIETKCFEDFINWVSTNYHQGIHGEPIDWKEYRQRAIIF